MTKYRSPEVFELGDYFFGFRARQDRSDYKMDIDCLLCVQTAVASTERESDDVDVRQRSPTPTTRPLRSIASTTRQKTSATVSTTTAHGIPRRHHHMCVFEERLGLHHQSHSSPIDKANRDAQKILGRTFAMHVSGQDMRVTLTPCDKSNSRIMFRRVPS
jgi:hypothetical protein